MRYGGDDRRKSSVLSSDSRRSRKTHRLRSTHSDRQRRQRDGGAQPSRDTGSSEKPVALTKQVDDIHRTTGMSEDCRSHHKPTNARPSAKGAMSKYVIPCFKDNHNVNITEKWNNYSPP